MARPPFRMVPYRLLPNVDWLLLVCVVALASLGILTLWGATSGGEGPGPLMGSARRQGVWFLMGCGALLFLALIDYRRWLKLAWPLYVILVLALVGLLIQGAAIKGARSWYDLGPFNLQPSEPGKIIVVLALASYLAPRADRFRGFFDTFVPLLIVGLPMGLILVQPDFGTAVVFIPIAGAMFWVAGIRKRVLVAFLLAGIVLAGAGYPHLKPYQKNRIKVFLNPEADPRGKGYNIIQAQTALGSGEVIGKGWGRGTQTNFKFLPEYETDFIFPTVGEQFGLVGGLLVLALFGLLIARMTRLAAVTHHIEGVLVATGLTAALATHVVMNIGMTVGLLPVTGLPLPFFSYGGSFMLSTMAMIGLTLGIGARREL